MLGTILGKVFHDANANGRQDPGEVGLNGVRLALEDGTVVTTDPQGRYSIPGVLPGRHVLAPDPSTLPSGASVTTDRARLITMTDALLARANVGVRLAEGASVPAPTAAGHALQAQVIPEASLPARTLMLRLEQAGPALGTGTPALEFRPHLNYPLLIHSWRILIEDHGRALRHLEGVGAPPDAIAWDGRDHDGHPLAPGRRYEARLEVADAQGHVDSAPLSLLPQPDGRVSETFGSGPGAAGMIGQQAGLPRYAIPLDRAVVVTVRGVTEPSATLTAGGATFLPNAMGAFERQLIVPGDTKTVTVASELPSGEQTAQTFPVALQDHQIFLVALGEVEIGKLRNSGRLEVLSPQDRNRMEHALYADGRMAYYLKAKIKGKYLVTSSFDMDRERKALFRQLDEDEFYPVYGDASTLNLEASDTQDELYLLIEADKSYALWGSYGTGLTGTQLANYNRTLHGLKIHHETLATAADGTPATQATVFGAKMRQLGAHDELQGTGGVLYYLRQQDVIEGSEKVTLEIRDQITHQPLERRALLKGQDYDIDYTQGRLRFYRPVMSVADGALITSTELLGGHTQFVVVDYEFKSSNLLLQEQAHGGRLTQAVGDALTLGTTYVRQEEASTDYELQGLDAKLTLRPGTVLSAEVAHSTAELARQAVSTDGGLSFTTLTGGSAQQGDAWSARLDSHVGATQVEASYQAVDPGFSNSATISQQGTDKFGFRTRTVVTPGTDIVLQHDTQRITGDGNARTSEVLGAQSTHTSSAQVIQRVGAAEVTGEYRHQERDRARDARQPSGEDLVAARVDLPVTDEITVYGAQQAGVREPGNAQSTVGLEAELDGGRAIALEQTAGHLGDATRLRVSESLANGLSIYQTAAWEQDAAGGSRLVTGGGISKELGGGGRLFLDEEFRTASDGPSFGRIIGAETPLTDRLRLTTSFERGNTQSATEDASHDAWHVALSYANPLKVQARSEVELRYQDGATNERQVSTQQELKVTPTQDLTLFSQLEYAKTENTRTNLATARTKEVHLGAAYRPVEHDRFNALSQYVLLEDQGSTGQADVDGLLGEQHRILSMEGAYDLGANFELVGKLARRDSVELISASPPAKSSTYQWITRLNYHLTDAWDLGLEHRILRTRQADDLRRGFAIEVDRTLWKALQVGVGYAFTKYTEDITRTEQFRTNRWYLRMGSKFGSWSPDELAAHERLQVELMREELVWRFAHEWILSKEPQTLETLNRLLWEADQALAAEDPATAEARYQDVLTLTRDLRQRAAVGLDQRMAQEDALAAWLKEASAAMNAGDEPRAAELYDRVIRGISAFR